MRERRRRRRRRSRPRPARFPSEPRNACLTCAGRRDDDGEAAAALDLDWTAMTGVGECREGGWVKWMDEVDGWSDGMDEVDGWDSLGPDSPVIPSARDTEGGMPCEPCG